MMQIFTFVMFTGKVTKEETHSKKMSSKKVDEKNRGRTKENIPTKKVITILIWVKH